MFEATVCSTVHETLPGVPEDLPAGRIFVSVGQQDFVGRPQFILKHLRTRDKRALP